MFFFFNDTATTEIYTLSLHDALPILELRDLDERPRLALDRLEEALHEPGVRLLLDGRGRGCRVAQELLRSEEHTSELQSRQYLVCRLLLEKKKLANHSRAVGANLDRN